MNAPITKDEADEFDAAFAESVTDKPVEAVETAEVVEAVEPVASEPKDETPPPDEASEASAESVPADDAPAEEPVEAEKDTEVDWEAAFRNLKTKFDAAEASKQEPPKPAPAEPPKEVPVYTDEETAALKEYEENWPEVSKGEALRRRAEYAELVKYIFSAVAKELKPIYDNYTVLSDNAQYDAVVKAHSDYDAAYEPLLGWIAKQPSYLKAAYEQVAKQGSAQDVIDLVSRFKKETGWKAPADTTPKPSTPSKGLPTTAKQAAKSLGAVSTKRTAVAESKDPNDFDGAFEEFAKQ